MEKFLKILKGPLDDVGIKTKCYFMVQSFFLMWDHPNMSYEKIWQGRIVVKFNVLQKWLKNVKGKWKSKALCGEEILEKKCCGT